MGSAVGFFELGGVGMWGRSRGGGCSGSEARRVGVGASPHDCMSFKDLFYIINTLIMYHYRFNYISLLV